MSEFCSSHTIEWNLIPECGSWETAQATDFRRESVCWITVVDLHAQSHYRHRKSVQSITQGWHGIRRGLIANNSLQMAKLLGLYVFIV